jgi:hypothetical protein
VEHQGPLPRLQEPAPVPIHLQQQKETKGKVKYESSETSTGVRLRIPFVWEMTLHPLWVVPDVSKNCSFFIFKGLEVREE